MMMIHSFLDGLCMVRYVWMMFLMMDAMSSSVARTYNTSRYTMMCCAVTVAVTVAVVVAVCGLTFIS